MIAPRPWLAGLEPARHGGPDYAELRSLGVTPAGVLDFSVNTNPATPPKGLLEAAAAADLTTYPDSECRDLREAAARRYGVTPDHVLAGNGSSELIWLIALAYLGPGDRVLIRQPTFGEYEVSARIQGATVEHFEEPWPEGSAKLAFVCNPNNPTGDYRPPGGLRPDTLYAIDEAYADFVDQRPTAIGLDMPGNLIVLRSLTKFSAMPGLRLGLAFARPPVIATLRKVKPPWNVNAAAQAAGIYALDHPELLPDLQVQRAAKALLHRGLLELGLQPEPTDCNFLLVRTGSGAETRQALLRQGILVRDCASFGLPEHVRIAVRSEADCRRLLAAIAEDLRKKN